MDTIAVIVAAGRGTRAGGGDTPKQYRLLAGEAVLARTIAQFVAHDGIDAVLTVIHEDDRERYASVAEDFSSKLLPPVLGGASRQASVYAGLQALHEISPAHVLIHDAARPFASAKVICDVIAALSHHDGAVPAMPVTDTLKRVENSRVMETLDRSSFMRAQTPQGFAYKRLLKAHKETIEKQAVDFTDDASLAEWHGLDVAVVEGDEKNFKLTSNDDFEFAEAMLLRSDGGHMSAIRIGQGFDVHAFTDGDHVVLGGVKIPHDKGLAGHSDADVALHALTDALLGAIGDGDIGTHFPPSDPQWSGASSDLFLRDAGRRVRDRNGEIANADVTIICETPKIGPHSEAMRKRIAEILGLDVDCVSVKATTTEGLGFTGRGEGIAAQAAVLVKFA